MKKLLISGYCGTMGQQVCALARRRGDEIVGGVDKKGDDTMVQPNAVPLFPTFCDEIPAADCIVDFSHHSLTPELLAYGVSHATPIVIATTGQTESEKSAISVAAQRIPIFFAPNYSLGIVLLIDLAIKTASFFPDAEIEIVEKHHSQKNDAPSGTALAIAESIAASCRPDAILLPGRRGFGQRQHNEIGIHSVRIGSFFGEHEVLFGTANQTISIGHISHGREAYAEGALRAAAYLIQQKNGLFGMPELLHIFHCEGDHT